MDTLSNLALGLSVAVTPVNLLYCLIGSLIGTLIGVLPGIGVIATLSMLLPITLHLSPVTALIMLAGIYYGAQYGGSTTAILVNMPGESSSVVTCLDGYQMARKGRAGAALAAVLDKPGGTLAGKSTLNRLEHAGKIRSDSRHHKLDHDTSAIEPLFVALFLDAHREPPLRIVLDLDATDDPAYGAQEGRHFHGYYDCYCYLPLYIFCGRHLLAAKLRTSSVDAADGATQEVERIVAQIRARWPKTTIVVRADSGFCRDDLMAWCEANHVQYVLGLAGNSRLVRKLGPEMRKAKRKAKRTGLPARVFADFDYRTRKSWSVKRRVIGKAEWTQAGANPRFIVTNVHAASGVRIR